MDKVLEAVGRSRYGGWTKANSIFREKIEKLLTEINVAMTL